MTIPTTTAVAARLERTARLAAPALALFITSVILLAELAYALGYQLGTALHARNDQLAALWRRCWVAEPAPMAAPALTPAEPTLAPLEHPLAAIAAELAPLTQRELLRVTGIRSKRAKAQLIAAYLAA